MKNKHHTLILAHRGANRAAYENTQVAFERARSMGVDGYETDIQLTKDEVAVLWHDRNLHKLGQAELCIDDLSYDELSALAKQEDIAILSLAGFWQEFSNHQYLVLEVKNRSWEPVVRHQLKMQQTIGLASSVNFHKIWVSSFSLNSLIYAYEINSSCPLVYNLEPEQLPTEIIGVADQYSFLTGFCLPIESLSRELVHELKKRNKLLAVYTCNTTDEVQLALNLELDILISDVPDFALAVRRQYAA